MIFPRFNFILLIQDDITSIVFHILKAVCCFAKVDIIFNYCKPVAKKIKLF